MLIPLRAGLINQKTTLLTHSEGLPHRGAQVLPRESGDGGGEAQPGTPVWQALPGGAGGPGCPPRLQAARG